MTKPQIYLLAILILAAVLRFWGLASESLWLDEAITANYFCQQSLGQVFVRGTQGLLFVVLTSAFCSIAGWSEFALRFLPAMFGIGVVYAGYLLAKKLFNETAALLTALLMAVNPFIIHYSQEARPYSLFLLASILSVYFVLRMAETSRTSDAVGYALAANVALYSHPFAVFLLPTHIIVWALYFQWREKQKRPQSLRMAAIAAGIAFLLFSPQFFRYAFLFLKKASGAEVVTWIPFSDTDDLLYTLSQYFGGYWIVRAVALLVLPAVIVCVIKRENRKRMVVPIVLFVFSVLMPWAISTNIVPIYMLNYSIPGVAALILIIAFSLAALPKLPRILLLIGILLLTMIPLKRYYTLEDKDPWRQTVQELRTLLKKDDLLVVDPNWSNDPIEYYFKKSIPVRVLYLKPGDDPRSEFRNAGRIWLVSSYYSNDGQRERELLAALTETHVSDSTISMNAKIRENPSANHIVAIDLTRFQRKAGL
jgi:mannosyltransferase